MTTQILPHKQPFTLSLSKGEQPCCSRSWFDKLTTNGAKD